MRILFKLSIFIFVISGCTGTAYQKSGLTGGFSETKLGENMYQVNFRGNGFTSRERAADFTLLRSAELTINEGYQYFSITSGESSTDISFHKTPARTRTDFNATTYGNSYTNTAQTYGTARTRTTGGQVYSVSSPRQSNTIIMFHEKPDDIEPYDARFIYQSIRKKYGMNEDS
jgi:hypothetical protein